LAVIAVIVGVQLFGIYNYDNLRDIRQIRPVVRIYLDLTRAIGFNQAFYEVGDVSARLLKAPEGLEVRSDVGTFNLEAAANTFSGWNQFNSPELGTLLRAAQGYDRLTYTRSGGGGAPAQAYVFWYRKSADALKAAREARVNTPATVLVESRRNVLILIQGQDEALRNDVRQKSVRARL
jgi:hypothetical protein